MVRTQGSPLHRHAGLSLSGMTLSSYALMAVLALPVQAEAASAMPSTAATLGNTAAPISDASPPAGGRRDPPSCQTVRFSDVGWTDVTSTTALIAQLLRSIGYSPTITVLSVPVTFASLQNNDIDVFLGNWMPAQAADRAPLRRRRIRRRDRRQSDRAPNTPWRCRPTPMPPVSRTSRIFSASRPELNDSIYGIEPGNDGNRHVLEMLKQNQFGLGDFKLIESSEQGMLAQVERAYRDKKPIVFLAWEPHPMNMRFDLKYLTGGDAVFGPNYGGATIYTVTRKGYSAECPNIGRLLANLKFTLRGESEMMAAILDRHEQPDIAATRMAEGQSRRRSRPGSRECCTFDGRPATHCAGARGARRRIPADSSNGSSATRFPVGDAMAVAIDYIKAHGTFLFDGISIVIRGMVDGVTAVLRALPAPAADRGGRRAGVGAAPLAGRSPPSWRWRCCSS